MSPLALKLAFWPQRPAHWYWLLPVLGYFLFPDNLVLLTQIAITGLFCMSLDLILGYAGIVSLGHAAFFGVGAYAAGLMAAHGMGEPLSAIGRSLPSRATSRL